MTREEMEKYINAPLCKELYEKLKIIYDKGYQDCKKEILDKRRAEISEAMDMEPAWKGQDNYIGGLQIACSIIDKYRNGGE